MVFLSAAKIQNEKAEESVTPRLILIDGSPKKERFLVCLDGTPVYLQGVCFRLFAMLGIYRLSNWRDGWVETTTLYRPPELVPRYVYRLRTNLYNDHPEIGAWPVVENFKTRDYRLVADPAAITLNPHNLVQFADHDIQVLLEQLTRERKQVSLR